ncbi:hypothetical protein K474DRAFT_1656770 [Panus rudis PR-1116 ss-1]|nr:hypothetical protein K474DRAFT_1656770 [Panus rudis PR-1116 ss-1]
MPFYRMLCIAAHNAEYNHIKGLVRRSASHIMDNGGVVRAIDWWGTKSLPQRMRRHRSIYTIGDYWTMSFDASPKSLAQLNATLRRDPLVIRWTVLKQGEKVEDVVEERGKTGVPKR